MRAKLWYRSTAKLIQGLICMPKETLVFSPIYYLSSSTSDQPANPAQADQNLRWSSTCPHTFLCNMKQMLKSGKELLTHLFGMKINCGLILLNFHKTDRNQMSIHICQRQRSSRPTALKSHKKTAISGHRKICFECASTQCKQRR